MFFTETGISNASFVIFVLAKNYRSPSSMDRIKDSGSFDMGSNPVGITESRLNSGFFIYENQIVRLL